MIVPGMILANIGLGLLYMIIGLAAAVAAGLLLSAASYKYKGAGRVISCIMSGIRRVPVIALASLFYFVVLCAANVVISFLSVSFVVLICVLPVTYFMFYEGFKSTSVPLARMASIFELSAGKKFKYIYLSFLTPFIKDRTKDAIRTAMKAAVTAEFLMGAFGGGGYLLSVVNSFMVNQQTYSVNQMFLVVLAIWIAAFIAICFVIELVLTKVVTLAINKSQKIEVTLSEEHFWAQ